MRFVWILAVVAAGCGPGNGKLDRGADPVDTTTDDPVPTAAGLVWVDADGEEVDGVVYLGDSLKYLDDDGYFWPLDPYGSGPEAFGVGVSHGAAFDIWADQLEVVFADDSCETAWAAGTIPPPLVVGIVAPADLTRFNPGDLDERTFVVPPDAEINQRSPVWVLDDGLCMELGVGYIAFDELIEVEPPDAWWEAPVHPEIR